MDDKLITSGVDGLRWSQVCVLVDWGLDSEESPGPVLKKWVQFLDLQMVHWPET